MWCALPICSTSQLHYVMYPSHLLSWSTATCNVPAHLLNWSIAICNVPAHLLNWSTAICDVPFPFAQLVNSNISFTLPTELLNVLSVKPEAGRITANCLLLFQFLSSRHIIIIIIIIPFKHWYVQYMWLFPRTGGLEEDEDSYDSFPASAFSPPPFFFFFKVEIG